MKSSATWSCWVRNIIYDFVITGSAEPWAISSPLHFWRPSVSWNGNWASRLVACTSPTYLIWKPHRVEDKTYAAQREGLQSIGIQPDILVLRTEKHLNDGVLKKGCQLLQRGFRLRDSERGFAKHLWGASEYAEPRSGQPSWKRWVWQSARNRRWAHGRVSWKDARTPPKRYTSDLWALTCRTPIRVSAKVCRRQAHTTITKTVADLHQLEKLTEENVGERLAGQDGIVICPDSDSAASRAKSSPLLLPHPQRAHVRHLSGYADDGDRVRPQRAGLRWCQQHRDRREDGAQRDRHHGGTEEYHQHGWQWWDWAPTSACWNKVRARWASTTRQTSRSATATATSSTATTNSNSKRPAWTAWARIQRVDSWKSWKSQDWNGTSAHSSILNIRAPCSSHIHCSWTSLKPQ